MFFIHVNIKSNLARLGETSIAGGEKVASYLKKLFESTSYVLKLFKIES